RPAVASFVFAVGVGRVGGAVIRLHRAVDDVAPGRIGWRPVVGPAAVRVGPTGPPAAAAFALLVHVVLLDEGQDVEKEPAVARVRDIAPVIPVPVGTVVRVHAHAGGEFPLVGVRLVDGGQGNLPQVVGTTYARGCLADLLDRGHQKPNQDGNDGNDHQQFN